MRKHYYPQELNQDFLTDNDFHAGVTPPHNKILSFVALQVALSVVWPFAKCLRSSTPR